MIVFSIISIIIFLYFFRFFGCCLNPGFDSIYDDLLVREAFEHPVGFGGERLFKSTSLMDVLLGRVEIQSGEFWVSINRWMMLVMVLAIAALIVNRILVIKKMIPEYKADIFIYLGVLEAVVIYLLTPLLFAKYEVKYFFVSITGISFAVLICYCFTMIAICHFSHEKEKAYNDLVHPEKEKTEANVVKEEKRIKTLKRVGITGIVLFELTLLFWFKSFMICMNYKENYGSYEQVNHTDKMYLAENYLGNYQNKAVNTDSGLYYIGYVDTGEGRGEGFPEKINKLDAEGNISEVYVGEDYLSSIAYYDGYLYAAHRRGIIKINPENGEAEKVLRPEDKYEFSDFCMVDNRMYIQSSPDADIKGVYSNTTDLKDYIVYCDIEGDSLSKPVLYLGDVKEYNHDRGYDGEILYMYVMNIHELHTYGYSRHQYYSDYGYEVSESVGDDGVENILSIEHRNIPDGCIEDVGAANVHNGAIYYVHLLEDGFEVCKCSIDGTNVEVLDTYKDGVDYRNVEMDTFKIAISDNKILVNSCDSYAKEGYVTGEWVNGVEFVTELR